ncbi:MAG: HAMP domain-containing histidine kinase [Bdellovibrionales bacterium]|nr:HAMP domain-containing histidine kinase [Bdellovibrionales bacterium]
MIKYNPHALAADRVFKGILIFISIYTLINAPFYWLEGARAVAISTALAILIATPITFLLMALKHESGAKLFFLLVCNFLIFCSSLGVGHRSKDEFHLLPLMVMSLIIFDKNRKLYTALGVCFSFATWLLITNNLTFGIPPSWIHTDISEVLLERINFLGAFITMCFFLSYYFIFLESDQRGAIQKAKLVSLGEMSAGVAHEINNPLAILSGTIQLLPSTLNNPDKLKAKIEIMRRASARIEKIVKGLRMFSSTEGASAHKIENLSEIIKQTIGTFKINSSFKSIEFKVHIQEDVFVLCDALAIEQVLINLVNNSIYAIQNLAQQWVEVSLFTEDSSIVLRVIDSGKGISQEVEGKLFQPFFTTKPVNEGTGLGLAISKGILDEHKASIFINDLFQNTCFEIRFQKG